MIVKVNKKWCVVTDDLSAEGAIFILLFALVMIAFCFGMALWG